VYTKFLALRKGFSSSVSLVRTMTPFSTPACIWIFVVVLKISGIYYGVGSAFCERGGYVGLPFLQLDFPNLDDISPAGLQSGILTLCSSIWPPNASAVRKIAEHIHCLYSKRPSIFGGCQPQVAAFMKIEAGFVGAPISAVC